MTPKRANTFTYAVYVKAVKTHDNDKDIQKFIPHLIKSGSAINKTKEGKIIKSTSELRDEIFCRSFDSI